jgi:hypothetical protein
LEGNVFRSGKSTVSVEFRADDIIDNSMPAWTLTCAVEAVAVDGPQN